MAFESRDEYERWKAERAQGRSAPRSQAPAQQAPPAKKGFAQHFDGIPRWAWVFVVACFGVPVMTLGGAIPVALGVGGASACATIARSRLSTAVRVVLCAAVVAAAWALVAMLLMALGAGRSR